MSENCDASSSLESQGGAGAVIRRWTRNDGRIDLNNRKNVLRIRKGRRILPTNIRHILEPGICLRIDHREGLYGRRDGGVIAVIVKMLSARIVPHLVSACDLRDHFK